MSEDDEFSCVASHLLYHVISITMADADDAIRARDGYHFAGGRLRVELSRGNNKEMGNENMIFNPVDSNLEKFLMDRWSR
jgi:hypothetical protein